MCPRFQPTHLWRLCASALLGGSLLACGGGGTDTAITASTNATTPPSATATATATASATSADAGARLTALAATEAVTRATAVVTAATGSSATATPPSLELTVRARADLAAGVGAVMQVWVRGRLIGQTTVNSTVPADYRFALNAPLASGDGIDVVFTNDYNANGEDRNLHVLFVSDGRRFELPSRPGTVFDAGPGSKAFDGVSTSAGKSALWGAGALRLRWLPGTTAPADLAQRQAASRFLQQASFGPRQADIDAVLKLGPEGWLTAQMAGRWDNAFVADIQARYALGDAYRPGGANYRNRWPAQRFWAHVAQRPDLLRQRVALALQQIFVASQTDGGLFPHARAYASYLDTLHRHAFGNYRDLMEAMALHPVMGLYLSHMRNRPEDPTVDRLPDENFARELMQLFTIGLVELNADGTPQRDSQGNTIETYSNADVMALAKVFTGWSWAFPDAELTLNNFRWKSPVMSSAAADTGVDLLPMKAYPGLHSTAAKPLFTGKPWARRIPANTSAARSLKTALDTLFNHPNVGPFVGRQLIQHLVTSHPSPAYVARVSAAFADNGAGVRGDMKAVVRAVLLDPEARNAPAEDFGKLREPVLRIAHFVRSFDAYSVTGEFMMNEESTLLGQRVLAAPSVFGDFRPGYVPPVTTFSDVGATVPEFQLVSESTTASWLNVAQQMTMAGLGWNGSARDVVSNFDTLAAWFQAGDLDAVLLHLDTLLYAGRMPQAVREDIAEAVAGVVNQTAADHTARARLAVLMALSATEYLVQR